MSVRKQNLELSGCRLLTITTRLTSHLHTLTTNINTITYTHVPLYNTFIQIFHTHITTPYTTYSTCRPHRVNDTDDQTPISVASVSLFTSVHGRPPLHLRPESTGTGQRRPAYRRRLATFDLIQDAPCPNSP